MPDLFIDISSPIRDPDGAGVAMMGKLCDACLDRLETLGLGGRDADEECLTWFSGAVTALGFAFGADDVRTRIAARGLRIIIAYRGRSGVFQLRSDARTLAP